MHLSKRARIKTDGFEQDKPKTKLNSHLIELIYAVESQLDSLVRRQNQSPTEIMRIEKLQNKLKDLLMDGLDGLKQIYGWWIDYHKQHISEAEVLEIATKELPYSQKRVLELYGEYISGLSKRRATEFKKFEIMAARETWNKEPYKSILDTYKQLQRGPSGNMGNDMALFNKALSTVHQGGPMLNYVEGHTSISKQLLDQLSGKQIDKIANNNDPITMPVFKIDQDELHKRVLEFEAEEEEAGRKKLIKEMLQVEKVPNHPSKEQALQYAEFEPEIFLSDPKLYRGFTELIDIAGNQIVNKNPAYYFLDKMFERPELSKFKTKAMHEMFKVSPSVYFTTAMHKNPEFAPYKDAAAFAMANVEPKFFLEITQSFPEFEQFRDIAESKLSKKAELIPGGIGSGLKPKDVDPAQLAAGIKVELEHTSDKNLAQEIALDHLAEDDKYYTKLLQMEKKSEAPGWWLSPDGKLFPVGDKGHVQFVLDHPELFGAVTDPFSALDIAINNGWVRVTWSGYLEFLLNKYNKPTFERIQNSLYQLPHNELEDEVVVISDGKKRIKTLIKSLLGATFSGIMGFMSSAELSISKRAAQDRMGWWLSPDGKLFEVPGMHHTQFVIDHPEIFGTHEALTGGAYDAAFSRKWIRIGLFELGYNIEFTGTFNDDVLLKLQSALSTLPRAKSVAVFASSGLTASPFSIFMGASNIRDLNKRQTYSSFKISKHASKDLLKQYKSKRDFDKTKEPEGKIQKGNNKHRFVIQKHDADVAGKHMDLRLENDKGTLSSWAIPKAHLPKGNERVLAIKTEDHPTSYIFFRGIIGDGDNGNQYGAGTVKIHSKGKYKLIEWGTSTIKFEIPAGKFTLQKIGGKRWLLMRSKKED